MINDAAVENTTNFTENSSSQSYLEARIVVVAPAGIAAKITLTPITRLSIFEIVNSIHFQYSDSAYLNEITDTVLSLTGLAQPQHIYSHLICGVVNQTKELLTLIYKNQTMPNGSTAVLAKSVPNHNDKITLLKY